MERLDAPRRWDFLDRAKADGRIVNAGFSFHGLGADFAPIVDGYPWECCLIQYNYLDEENQAGTRGLEYAASKGLGVFVMEPLRGGNLGFPEAPPPIAALWDEAPLKRTPAEWALRWVWDHPEVVVVLSGMNDEGHIEENLETAGEALPNSLTTGERALVKRAAARYKELMKVGCSGCGTACPAPRGLTSPLASRSSTGSTSSATSRGQGLLRDEDERRFAGGAGAVSPPQCVECGQCLGKCPRASISPFFLRMSLPNWKAGLGRGSSKWPGEALSFERRG